ncbi:hypothetical protein L8R94_18830 [Vibrio aestuarianus]|nr:hypothetical protein [Vibrio aestuarianus]MDE1287281.1 hypothetical protein [Vibrio aestuarianus]MDE1305335.1 hypothetical protein [Vibrio aestuarianus]MDH5866353.1 hypothetical protein [Vibrio aestuarianus]MDH5873806.1 hypothetical protein [Vibrio aestuarianus]MDH5948206.1 hypothetical protein [Vibrio aestuarianus]
MVKVFCGHFCIACLRPLTRRYVFDWFLRLTLRFH